MIVRWAVVAAVVAVVGGCGDAARQPAQEPTPAQQPTPAAAPSQPSASGTDPSSALLDYLLGGGG